MFNLIKPGITRGRLCRSWIKNSIILLHDVLNQIKQEAENINSLPAV
jgi:hypothetical protein